MVFAVGDSAMLGDVRLGEKVTFATERVKGRITIISLKVDQSNHKRWEAAPSAYSFTEVF